MLVYIELFTRRVWLRALSTTEAVGVAQEVSHAGACLAESHYHILMPQPSPPPWLHLAGSQHACKCVASAGA